ncbi:unnamed protein product, partial [Amoebophrya sp. A25]
AGGDATYHSKAAKRLDRDVQDNVESELADICENLNLTSSQRRQLLTALAERSPVLAKSYRDVDDVPALRDRFLPGPRRTRREVEECYRGGKRRRPPDLEKSRTSRREMGSSRGGSNSEEAQILSEDESSPSSSRSHLHGPGYYSSSTTCSIPELWRTLGNIKRKRLEAEERLKRAKQDSQLRFRLLRQDVEQFLAKSTSSIEDEPQTPFAREEHRIAADEARLRAEKSEFLAQMQELESMCIRRS